jgi:hypothetical protein
MGSEVTPTSELWSGSVHESEQSERQRYSSPWSVGLALDLSCTAARPDRQLESMLASDYAAGSSILP